MRVELQIERARPRLIRDGSVGQGSSGTLLPNRIRPPLLFGGFAVLAGRQLLGLKVSASVAISMIVIGAFWSLRGYR